MNARPGGDVLDHDESVRPGASCANQAIRLKLVQRGEAAVAIRPTSKETRFHDVAVKTSPTRGRRL
jgi:hypothetical protein